MQSPAFQPRMNPLTSYMRQPKIYITLPSRGNFWPQNSLSPTETGEFPVYSMTARDELMFKTPDALMNGQAVVDVIQSCIPNIKNAWDIPTVDIDTILIAIRLATYGERMPMKFKVPEINEEVEYEIDLRTLLDQQQQNKWIDQVVIQPDFIIYVRPLTFKHLTQTSLKSFETTRILNIVNDDSISEEKKLELFNSSFTKLTKITVDLMSASIYKVVTADAEVTEPRFIEEFVANADKDLFDVVQKHLNELKDHNNIKPLVFSTTPEQQEQGAPTTFNVPLNFNDSDFFARSF
jgi:hypothetical protein